MKQTFNTAKNWMYRIVTFAWLVGMSPFLMAQITTVTYVLDDVWLLPDISHPWEPAQQMIGTFEWSYENGDFENGTGQFIDLYVPWYGSDINSLNINIDLSSIELTLPGNYHGLGVDISLFLLESLSPVQPVEIDTARSMFDIENGISHKGHVVSGSITPAPKLSLNIGGTCPFDLQFSISNAIPNGQVAILYAFAEGSIVIPNNFSCAGTMLGLDNTATLGSTITADTNGDATLNIFVPAGACSTVFIQALDISNCETSGTLLLQ